LPVAAAAVIIWSGRYRETDVLIAPPARIEKNGTVIATGSGMRMKGDASFDVTLDTTLGRALVIVRASGRAAAGEWPMLRLILDGDPIFDWLIACEVPKLYGHFVFTGPGSHRLELHFLNPYHDGASNEERSIAVERVEVIQGHNASYLGTQAAYARVTPDRPSGGCHPRLIGRRGRRSRSPAVIIGE